MKVSLTPTASNLKYKFQSGINNKTNSFYTAMKNDSITLSSKLLDENDYKLYKKGNQLRLVSFKALQDPTVLKNPSIRVGLQNAKQYKENILETKNLPRGEKFNVTLIDDTLYSPDAVLITTQDGKTLGNMPKSVVRAIGSFLAETPSDFTVSLYGTTSASKSNPANVLIDIEYLGDKKQEVQENLNALLYKNSVSPEAVLHRILNYKKVLHGDKAGAIEAESAQKAIDTIVDTLKSSKNQKILLIGHNKPDGDTIGSCIGLKAALDYMGKSQVDIAIDDVMTGLLRNLIDPKDVKKSPEFIKQLGEGIYSKIDELEKKPHSLNNVSEIYSLLKVKNYYDSNTTNLNTDEKYDLAVFLDVATPSKVSTSIKECASNARNIIYIDHHPPRMDDWRREAAKSGIDMNAVIEKNMFWVEPKVPANTMLVTILVDKMLPNLVSRFRDGYFRQDIPESEKSLIQKMATGLVAGTITDTSGFRRTINRTSEDLALQSNKKTGFAPSGLADWLLNLTNGTVTRRSVKNTMKYSMPNKVDLYFPEDFVDFYNTETSTDDEDDTSNEFPDYEAIMRRNNSSIHKGIMEDVEQNTIMYKDLGLGISTVRYGSMKRFLKELNVDNPEINMRDVIGTYKYSPAVLNLKFPSKDPKYQCNPRYENNKISAFIREEEVVGELNTAYQVSKSNTLGFSFRSADGTNYAGMLGVLFGGGGHPAASGATFSLPGLTVDSRLKVKVDGKYMDDFDEIYNVMKNNYNCTYYDCEENMADVKFEIDDKGYSIPDLISGLTAVIRNNR